MVVRQREGLWGFWQQRLQSSLLGVVQAPEGRRESCGGMEKGAGRIEVRKEGKGCLREGGRKREGGG